MKETRKVTRHAEVCQVCTGAELIARIGLPRDAAVFVESGYDTINLDGATVTIHYTEVEELKDDAC